MTRRRSLGDDLAADLEKFWVDILSLPLCPKCRDMIQGQPDIVDQALRRELERIAQSLERWIYCLREQMRDDVKIVERRLSSKKRRAARRKRQKKWRR